MKEGQNTSELSAKQRSWNIACDKIEEVDRRSEDFVFGGLVVDLTQES